MRILKTVIFLFAAFLALGGPQAAGAEDLMAVYRLARSNDRGFQAARAARLAGLQAKPKALATLMPQVSLYGSTGINQFRVFDVDGENPSGSAVDKDYDSRKLGIRLTQSVVDLEKWTVATQSGYKAREVESVFKAEAQALMLKTAELYFKALAAGEALRLVRAEKKAVGESLAGAKEAAKAGLSSSLETQKAQARFDLIRAQEIAAVAAVADALEALGELTGRSHRDLALLPSGLALARYLPGPVKGLTGTALLKNLKLAALRSAMNGAKLEIKRQAAGHSPTLSLVASHGYSDVGGGRVSGTDLTSTVSLELNFPIFQGGGVRAATREAIFLHRKARAKYLAAKRSILRQLRSVHRDVSSNQARIQALRQAVKSNLAASAAAQKRFRVGAAVFLEVLESLRDLYQARRDLAQARYKFFLGQLKLRQLTGDLGVKDLARINRLLVEPAKSGRVAAR